jgi:hypothetical protein
MLIDPRARCLPCSCFKTNHSTPFWSHSYRLPTSRLRSLPSRREGRCRGRHGRSSSRGCASPRRRRRGAARKDGPNLPVPQHAQEAHGCRLLPHGSFGPSSRRQADAGCASRPIRIRLHADRLRARSRLPDPFSQPFWPLIAEEGLDNWPTERADVVDAGAAVVGVPEHARLRGERADAGDLQEELLVASKRQARGDVPPRVERMRKQDRASGQHSRRDREDRSTCANGSNRRQNHSSRFQLN